MIKFDGRDFTKSALSLAGGMTVVIGFVFWHSGGDIKAVCLTAGLPLGVLSFWAIYAMKMRVFEQRRNFIDNPLRAERHDEFSSYRRFESSFERRTLKGPISEPPRSLNATPISEQPRSLNGPTSGQPRRLRFGGVDQTRSRILQGRGPIVVETQEPESLDQWHQG